jgi:hypothetical protein
LLALACAPAAGHGQSYEVSGDLVYETFGTTRPRKPLERRFSVSVDGARWSIRTTLGGTNDSIESFIDAFDGTNLLGIVNYRGAANNRASVRVEPTDVPNPEMGTGSAALWLAFASAAHLRSQAAPRLAPIWLLDDPAQRAAGFTVAAKWTLSKAPPGLPAIVEYHDDGRVYFVQDGRSGQEPRPEPFDAGYVRATYRAFTFTNAAGLSVPRSFTYEEFRPDYARARTTNDVIRSLRISVSGAVLSAPPGQGIAPILFTNKVFVTDHRFQATEGVSLQYVWTNAVLAGADHPVVSSALRRARAALPQPEQPNAGEAPTPNP